MGPVSLHVFVPYSTNNIVFVAIVRGDHEVKFCWSCGERLSSHTPSRAPSRALSSRAPSRALPGAVPGASSLASSRAPSSRAVPGTSSRAASSLALARPSSRALSSRALARPSSRALSSRALSRAQRETERGAEHETEREIAGLRTPLALAAATQLRNPVQHLGVQGYAAGWNPQDPMAAVAPLRAPSGRRHVDGFSSPGPSARQQWRRADQRLVEQARLQPAASPEVQYLPPVQYRGPQGMPQLATSQPGIVQPDMFSTLLQLQMNTHERELELVRENSRLQAQAMQQRQEQRRQRSQRDLGAMLSLLQQQQQQQQQSRFYGPPY